MTLTATRPTTCWIYPTLIILVALLAACTAPERPAEATEPDTRRYQESPILRDQVERGQLPPVEERLPAEPFVVEPFDSVGTYESDFLNDLTQDEE